MLAPPFLVPLLGEQATDDDSVISTTTVLVGFEHIVPLLGKDCLPAFGMDTRHDLLPLLSIERRKSILNECTILILLDAGEVDVRGHLQFTGLTALETLGCDHCAHGDFLCFFHYCHPPLRES